MKVPPDTKPAAGPPATGLSNRIFTPNFLLAMLANLFTFGSFNMLLATMPIYVVRVGGQQSEVGLVIGAFALTALLVRPFSGLAADLWGRKRLMVLGGLGMALSALLYILVTAIPALMALRLLHGVAFGVISTATSALVADIAPPQRRGEAVGYFGMSNNIAMAAGPALGVVLMQALGFPGLFSVSAALGLAAFLCSLQLRGEAAQPHPAHRPVLLVRSSLFPASILFCFAFTYASIIAFFPLLAVQRGMSNPGLFFTVQALVMLSVRGFLGQLSDRWGRRTVVVPGLLLAATSQALLSWAASLPLFLTIAALYAVAFAGIQTGLMALVIDRVRPEMRGAAMGTYISAMDAGIGSGAILWGLVAGLWGYAQVYLLGALVPLVALALFLGLERRRSLRPLPE